MRKALPYITLYTYAVAIVLNYIRIYLHKFISRVIWMRVKETMCVCVKFSCLTRNFSNKAINFRSFNLGLYQTSVGTHQTYHYIYYFLDRSLRICYEPSTVYN